MNIASGLGQDGGGREGKTSRAGHLGSNFRIYRGRALVDSVGPAFGTAIFNCEGTKERFFFFKNKVFVNGKKVTSNTPLTDVLHCDTVVSFEAEPWGKQYDIRFRGLKVDVMNCRVSTDELLPATPYRGNSATQNHSASSMQVMRNHCARVKHISNEGGVLDHTPEVKFHCSVVCIPEYVEGVKTLPDLIPRCTPVNFDAVVTSSGVTATCLWVGDKQTDFKRGSDPDGYVKGWSGTVESYYSCNRGKVGRFKVQGQQMFALFSRQDVFFPEPSEVALQEYLPVGTMVHFDGKLISSGNTTLVKISRLWCGKRPGVVAAAPSQPSPRDCMDSVSSKCSSSLSMGSSTWDGTDVLTIGRNGKVSRYISEDAGFISCSRFGKESEVLFYRSDTDFSSETDGRTSLSAHLPIGSEVYFTAQMFSPGDVVVETVRLIKRHDSSTSPSVMDEESERATPALAEPLTNQSWPEPANDTGVVDGSSPWESLTGRCGVVKFYNSQSEGVLDCIINNVTIEIVFIKGSVLLEPQLCRKQLSKALPVGTSVYFDAKVIMLNGYFEFVATTMWIKKKPKPESAALDSTVVSNTTTELVLRNRTAKVKCFVSDVEGIVEFLFEHTLKEAFFHKDVVFIPKDYNLSVQDYLTVGRSVFFDGHFEKETSGVITITSLWAEKKTKLVVPSPRVVDVSEEVETEMKPQASDCNGIGGRVSAGTSESFSPGGSDRTATSAPKDSEMLGTMPKSIRGHAATVVSYTSKSTGIVQCTVLKKQMTAMFCRGNLLVPDKLKDWPLEEYLPAGKSVYLDGEVSRGEGGLALSVTRLWVGKKPRQCAEESALSLPAGPATLSQTEVYEAEVASVERMCFTACVSLGDSRVAVLVWNQFFRPSLMCEEPLREGELVNLHVSAGDKVFLRVVRNYGKNKDQYEWCACDAWKDNGEVPDERSSSGCGRDETCREGSIVWLDEVSAIVQYGVDGMGVTFRREVALLFGICLATFDLTKVFSIDKKFHLCRAWTPMTVTSGDPGVKRFICPGDTVSFILANDVEASKAWFDSCTIDGSASVFLQVEKFCRARSIPSEVKRALVNQLCHQTSKEGPASQTSCGTGSTSPAAFSGNKLLTEETEDTEDDLDYIFVSSSSASSVGDYDSNEFGITSDEFIPSKDVCQKLANYTLPDVREFNEKLTCALTHSLHSKNKTASSPAAEEVQPSENKPASSLALEDVQPSEDKPASSPAAENVQPSEDKPASLLSLEDVQPFEDKPASSLSLENVQPFEDKPASSLSLEDVQPFEDKPASSPAAENVQPSEDKPASSPAAENVQPSEDKPASSLSLEDVQPFEDKPASSLSLENVQPFEDKPASSLSLEDVQPFEDKPASSLSLENVQPFEDKPASSLSLEDVQPFEDKPASSLSLEDVQPFEDKPASSPAAENVQPSEDKPASSLSLEDVQPFEDKPASSLSLEDVQPFEDKPASSPAAENVQPSEDKPASLLSLEDVQPFEDKPASSLSLENVQPFEDKPASSLSLEDVQPFEDKPASSPAAENVQPSEDKPASSLSLEDVQPFEDKPASSLSLENVQPFEDKPASSLSLENVQPFEDKPASSLSLEDVQPFEDKPASSLSLEDVQPFEDKPASSPAAENVQPSEDKPASSLSLEDVQPFEDKPASSLSLEDVQPFEDKPASSPAAENVQPSEDKPASLLSLEDVQPFEDKPASSLSLENVQPFEDKPASSLSLEDVQPFEDKPASSPAAENVQPSEDKPASSPAAENVQPSEDKPASSLSLENVQPFEDKPASSLSLEDVQPFEDKPASSPAAENVQPSEDKPASSPAAEIVQPSEDKPASPLSLEDILPSEDKPASSLSLEDVLPFEDKPASSLSLENVLPFEDKPAGSPAVENARTSKDKLARSEVEIVQTSAGKPPTLLTSHLLSTKEYKPRIGFDLTEENPIRTATMDLLITEDQLTTPLPKTLQPKGKPESSFAVDLGSKKDKPCPQTMDLHLTEKKAFGRDLHSSVMQTSPVVMELLSVSCAHARESRSSGTPVRECTFDHSFLPLLQSSLEAVLISKGVEPKLSRDLASEVAVLVHENMGPNRAVTSHDQSSQSGLASGSEHCSEVGQSEGNRAIKCTESSAQTISTGHIISLNYLP